MQISLVLSAAAIVIVYLMIEQITNHLPERLCAERPHGLRHDRAARAEVMS